MAENEVLRILYFLDDNWDVQHHLMCIPVIMVIS